MHLALLFYWCSYTWFLRFEVHPAYATAGKTGPVFLKRNVFFPLVGIKFFQMFNR